MSTAKELSQLRQQTILNKENLGEFNRAPWPKPSNDPDTEWELRMNESKAALDRRF